MAGNVQRIEVVPIGIDARPFGHGKPHFSKDRGHLFAHLADRVNRALAGMARRQGDIQPLTAQPFIKGGIAKSRLFGHQRAVDLILERVQRWTSHLAFFGGHATKFAHFQRNFALFAHCSEADRLKRAFVTGVGNFGQVFRFEIIHRLGSAPALRRSSPSACAVQVIGCQSPDSTQDMAKPNQVREKENHRMLRLLRNDSRYVCVRTMGRQS